MPNFIQQKFDHWKANGKLAIFAALLLELLIVLWLSFLALFALETLLPTFVTVRLSLTNFLAFLLLTTVFYLFFERQLDLPTEETKTPRWLTVGVWTFGFFIIALSLARFSIIGVLIFLIAYLLLTWLLTKFVQER
ncbi:MAG: hypothetical protein E6R05_04205 [Candidatus Moraniibacteriota bacterium]|nr:MAG: hypothetical protein E6R05_04205 [Candidatus Moranbacteria bacterium]